MTNENCLEGVRCPHCGHEDELHITATIICHVTDDGSDPAGDHDWDEDSFTHCPECGFGGKLREFREHAGASDLTSRSDHGTPGFRSDQP